MVIRMKDIFIRMRWRGMEFIYGQMGINILEVGRILNDQGKDCLFLRMVVNIRDNGFRINAMDLGCNMTMKEFTKENGNKIRNMEKD